MNGVKYLTFATHLFKYYFRFLSSFRLKLLPLIVYPYISAFPFSGKSQVIRQFVECDFSEAYHPTKAPKTYYATASFNERVYPLAIVDLPHTWRNSSKTPVQNYEGIPADAYIFVFDVTSEDSFGYIRRLRDQMVETSEGQRVTRTGSNSFQQNNNGNSGISIGNGGGSTGVPLVVMGNKYDLLFAAGGHLSRRYTEMVYMIKKHWGGHYVYIESSARANWQIFLAFKTLTKLIDIRLYGNHSGSGVLMIPSTLLKKSRCIICWLFLLWNMGQIYCSAEFTFYHWLNGISTSWYCIACEMESNLTRQAGTLERQY